MHQPLHFGAIDRVSPPPPPSSLSPFVSRFRAASEPRSLPLELMELTVFSFSCWVYGMLMLPCSAGLEGSKQYRFRIRPVFGGGAEEQGHEWGWSPASVLASPAVLNSFLRSHVPTELVGRGKAAVSRDVLAGKIVGETVGHRINGTFTGNWLSYASEHPCPCVGAPSFIYLFIYFLAASSVC